MGGKSRKSGGVSKQLISRLTNANYSGGPVDNGAKSKSSKKEKKDDRKTGLGLLSD